MSIERALRGSFVLRTARLSLALGSVLALWGCGPKDWREARQANTSAGYVAYVSAHAGEPRSAIAAKRAERLGWEEANAANSSAAFTTFAVSFPKSEHALEARGLAESKLWEEASAEGSLSSLSSFLGRYPQSIHRAEAEATIEDLHYAEAKAGGTSASWGQYLSLYPLGKHADEATAARDALDWSEAVLADSRHAYRQYLERFPQGQHAAEARTWLAATYVTRIQPIVALVETYQPVSMHLSVMARVRKELDEGLIEDLGKGFSFEATRVYDATRGFPHPQDLLGSTPGTGILVIEYYERVGRRFEPSGEATDISAVVRLYAPNTRNAVWVRELEASTPDRVVGADRSALHTSAVADLGDQLRSLVTELSIQRPEGS